MKLNGHIIITLPDFARHFSLNEFWENRFAFVRDFHPDRVCYWNERQVDAYDRICDWIAAEAENRATGQIREQAVSGLQLLTGAELDPSDLRLYNRKQNVDGSSDIIMANAPGTLVLPGYEGTQDDGSAPVRLYKITVCGHAGQKSDVFIGEKHCGTFDGGEVVYVTARNGRFIEIFPNYASNEIFDAGLIDNGGGFRSILTVKDKRTGGSVKIRDVVAFALVDEGYVYIDFQDTVVYNNVNVPFAFVDNVERKAVALNYSNGVFKVLYENGTVSSSDSFEMKESVYIK